MPVAFYFTIQPGAGYIQVNSNGGPKGARLIYPNSFHQASGTKMDFWHDYGDGSGEKP